MFKNTMAVGPFDPVASCVTGGTAVAKPQCRGVFNLQELAVAERSTEALLPHNRRETSGLNDIFSNRQCQLRRVSKQIDNTTGDGHSKGRRVDFTRRI